MNVYLDYSATTPVKPEVLEAMMPFLTQQYGNPSSLHRFGRESRKAVDVARDQIAKTLNASPDEIFFTGGGSEADNWAIKGTAYALQSKGRHIITTAIEHHAVLHACEYLEKEGFQVTYLPVDESGLISLEDLKNAIKSDTILISVMYANNEIGTIQPIEEIGRIAREHRVLFHTDAVQTYGHLVMDTKQLPVDMISISAHKLYGPKGVGALYLRKGVRIHNLIHGGGQEKKKRAGTENIAGIVGFGKAAELAYTDVEAHDQRLTALRDNLKNRLMETIPYTRLNGHPERRLCNNVNLSFEFIEGESMLLSLDMVGIGASSGSACTSGSLDPSHVLLAIGLSHEIAHGSLRLTLGDMTTQEEIDYVVEQLPPIVQRLRDMSPLYEQVKEGNR
ncbi:cysteine desulfurase NifS [Anoxynatronum buryatiense]|uniref:Cysteine desulfurase IscS n=1 Tax=Anoxynatronum buryatiense TaxID=489973 RepID=A0AA45WV18_9CLOT|nr:cysteine desulfurase NifS [Anoxynatronum buryatiense]SMP49052.1 cysteine desulfurase [Anoxynatronum buryatiense]